MKPLSKQTTTPNMEGITERTIITLEGGWEEREYYLVDVAFSEFNVIHRTIFYTGFLNNRVPAGYNQFWFQEDIMNLSKAYFVKAIAKIDMFPDMKDIVLDMGRDWLEDTEHENGNYQNICGECQKLFMGHKRRVVCKLCVRKI